MQNRTENNPHPVAESDEIRITRPDWVTSDDDWSYLKEEITRGIDGIVKDVVGPPPPPDDCGRSWCIITGQDHRAFHATHPVDLIGSVRDGTQTAWWGWLTQDEGADRITLVVEGHLEPGAPAVDFMLPLWQVELLRWVIEDQVGLDRLWTLVNLVAKSPS